MRARRAIHNVLGPAGPMLIAAAVAAVPAAHAKAMSTRATPAAVLTGTGVLDDVVAITAANAWAVGRRISIPLPANGGMLIGVYAASGRNAWAVGSTKTFANIKARPLVLHWNGTAWR